MKKVLCSVIALFMLFMCFGCKPESSTFSDEDFMLSLKIFYVDNNKIKSVEERLDSSGQSVIKKWLTQNGLDDRFTLIGSYINKGDPKLDGLSDEYELPEYRKSGFVYIYDDIYEYYFDADITGFLEKSENKLYSDSLKATLDYARDEVSKQNWAEEYWAQKAAEQQQ